MSVYAFNDKLEKVKVIELTGYQTVSAGDIGSVSWNSTALAAAGVDTSDLLNYIVLDFQTKVGSGNLWTVGRSIVVTGGSSTAPYIFIDGSSTTITATLFNEDSSAQTISVKVRLMKVA